MDDGQAVEPAHLLQSLLTAQSAGDLQFTRRRWSLPFRGARDLRPEGQQDRAPDEANADIKGRTSYLNAIPADVLSGAISIQATEPDQPLTAGQQSSWHLFPDLLTHYGDCLRLGGATRVGHFVDKHALQFHLLDVRGRWWPDEAGARAMRISRDELGGPFLQALARRVNDPVLLGYPISVAHLPDGGALIHPVTLLQCKWKLDDVALNLWPIETAPVLNPDWTGKRAQRREFKSTLKRLGELTMLTDEELSGERGDYWQDVPEMARAITTFLPNMISDTPEPARLRTRLDLAESETIQNVLGLFLVSENPYTDGARSDLLAMRSIPQSDLRSTALEAIFGEHAVRHDPVEVASPLPLGEDQFVAVREGLQDALTVISGPPGTGKSQVVAALMMSAATAGKSVLFASHTHKALDAVQQRVADLYPNRPLLAHAAGNNDGVTFDFRGAIDALLARLRDSTAREALQISLAKVETTNKKICDLVDCADKLTACSDELSRLWGERERRESRSTVTRDARDVAGPRPSWIERLMSFVRRIVRTSAGSTLMNSEEQGLSDRQLSRAIHEAENNHRVAQRSFDDLKGAAPLPDLLDELSKASSAILPLLAAALDSADANERERLTKLLGNIGLAATKPERLAVWRENTDLILRHFPLWSTTALSAPNRIPLVPAMFDYVIIDEATTCNIAQAIPLLARATRAIIVGDKMQTGMVSDLDPGREREMLRRSGLNDEAVGRFSFTQVSLFDLANSCTQSRRHLLRDHFRCAPQIAGFISETFYGGQLFARTDASGLKAPRTFKSGMHWTDIQGPIEAAGNGCRSLTEATTIATHISDLLERQGYLGTVGVVTPFQRQAELILRLVEQKVSFAKIESSRLVIGTSHKFQGDDRDLILVSLCYGSGMPRGSEWFLAKSQDWLNVAVSRARAVCHIFGDRAAAEKSQIPHIRRLARWLADASPSRAADKPEFESPWERRLYEALRARDLTVAVQYPLAGKRLDLAIITDRIRLDIEVDGETYHRDRDGFRKVSDHWRDHVVQSLGWRVRRFWVYELNENMEACVERVIGDLQGRPA